MPSRNQILICRQRNARTANYVVSLFATCMLAALGFSDSQVRTKGSIGELITSRGLNRMKYRPGYAIIVSRLPRIVIETKAESKSLDP